MFNQPDSRPNFSQIDVEVTKWWKENDTFQKSINIRESAEEYIFYDGPPFMSGMPHYATLLSSIPKDIIPRYQTMKGKHVERLWGWDTHGLPIENKVEKQMGLSGRKQISAKLEEFIEKCYEWNRVGIENWRWYIDKIGRWADLDNAYRTLDQDYMESVWWVFAQMWDKGLVYKGRRTSMFSTDSSTPVSDFEVSMDPDNYRDTEDIAVYTKFKLTEDSINQLGIDAANAFLVAWTTTPWTLPSNFALAVNPDAEYVFFEHNGDIVAVVKDRLEAILGEDKAKEAKIITKVKGSKLVGFKYVQLFDHFKGGENDFQVYESEYVTLEDGSGILHVAPAFGEADAKMGEEWGLSFDSDIDDAGNMLIAPWEGMYLRDANPKIADKLEGDGMLLKQEKYVHRLPYYRYDNPLIYKTEVNYFVAVHKFKDQLLKSNQEINWFPEHFKEGRFKYILETAPDWSISRNRFWGTVMPIWEASDGDQIVVASRDQLMELVNASDNELTIKKVNLELHADCDYSSEQCKQDIDAFISSDKQEMTYGTTQEMLSELRHEYFGETEAESQVKPIKAGEKRAYYLINGKPLDLHRPYIDDIWLTKDDKEYRRIEQTLDVWMDSGSMPFAQFHYPYSNKEKFDDSFPGDFISEYTGQIRAWFYVLHVISNAVFDKPAFKNVLVTGVLGGNDGRKMSKSFGNYPDPKETLEEYGGDALRLYLMSTPLMHGNDANFSEEELKLKVREFLIPLWNIYKYFVTYANITEWEPTPELLELNLEEAINSAETELDRWILIRANQQIKEVDEKLTEYDIPNAIKALLELINETSKWFIRRSRDRFAAGDTTPVKTLYYVLYQFTRAAAPVVPFVTEEIYRGLVADKFSDQPESVHLTQYPVTADNSVEHVKKTHQMEAIRKVCELGQSIRANNGLKVRQPLAEIQILDSDGVSEESEWVREIIASELNIKQVTATEELSSGDNWLLADDHASGITVAINTELTEELKIEGVYREISRQLQSMRRKAGLDVTDKIQVSYQSDSATVLAAISEFESQIMETVGALSISEAELNEEAIKLNGHELKLSIAKL